MILAVNEKELHIPLYYVGGNSIEIKHTVEDCIVGPNTYLFPLVGNPAIPLEFFRMRNTIGTNNKFHTVNVDKQFDAFMTMKNGFGAMEVNSELYLVYPGGHHMVDITDGKFKTWPLWRGLKSQTNFRAVRQEVEQMAYINFTYCKGDVGTCLQKTTLMSGIRPYIGNYAVIDLKNSEDGKDIKYRLV